MGQFAPRILIIRNKLYLMNEEKMSGIKAEMNGREML
jgi:hypothetical protein